MTKGDDSSLDPEQRRLVEERARNLLNRAGAWDRFPTPVDDLLAAAKLKVASSSAFDPAAIMTYISGKAAGAVSRLKSALSKVLGIYHADENTIHIDTSVVIAKQTFLKLHETGHHELPVHRKLFGLFQDCQKTLDPMIADLFEREANNFARFALFQDNRFGAMAADLPLGIKTPMRLASKFGASIYAASREYARTSHHACVVYVLQRPEFVPAIGFRAEVRRIEPSPSYRQVFGVDTSTAITPTHRLWNAVPVGRKVTKPTGIQITDLNGEKHEAVVEAFDTSHNVIILVHSTTALRVAQHAYL